MGVFAEGDLYPPKVGAHLTRETSTTALLEVVECGKLLEIPAVSGRAGKDCTVEHLESR